PGRQRRYAVIEHAALVQVAVEDAVPFMALAGGGAGVGFLLRLRSQRRDSAVGRVDDDRGALQQAAALPPDLVVRARVASLRRFVCVAAVGYLLLALLLLLVGQLAF